MRRVVAIAVAALIAGGSPALAATKINFLYNASAAFAAMFVAQDQGYLQKRGLDVDFSLAQSGAMMPPALISDSAQIGAPTATVLLQADEQGMNLVMIANTSVYPTPAGSDGVVARTGSGIKDARDLVGKKVGLPSLGGIFEVLMRNWLRSQGVDDRQVQLVEVQLRQMPDALKSGLVDAVAPVEPFYSRIIDAKLGYNMGDFQAAVPAGTSPVLYAATRSWVAAHPDAVKSFRAALEEAVVYIKDPAHAASVRTSIAQYTKLPPEAAATLAIPTNLEVKPKPENLIFWIKACREQGVIKGNPNPASLMIQ